jgi:hypothetical protein
MNILSFLCCKVPIQQLKVGFDSSSMHITCNFDRTRSSGESEYEGGTDLHPRRRPRTRLHWRAASSRAPCSQSRQKEGTRMHQITSTNSQLPRIKKSLLNLLEPPLRKAGFMESGPPLDAARVEAPTMTVSNRINEEQSVRNSGFSREPRNQNCTSR